MHIRISVMDSLVHSVGFVSTNNRPASDCELTQELSLLIAGNQFVCVLNICSTEFYTQNLQQAERKLKSILCLFVFPFFLYVNYAMINYIKILSDIFGSQCTEGN